MKLTLKIKLLPNEEQSVSLLNTIREFNAVCNSISETIFEQKIYNQFKVYNLGLISNEFFQNLNMKYLPQ